MSVNPEHYSQRRNRWSVPMKSRRWQAGASLLEVMISVLIMGIGLLGIAAMQGTALRNSQSALERSQATIQAYSILEAMRANRAVAVGGGYDMALTCAAPASGDLAANDKQAWISSIRATKVLGDAACGQIACLANSACTITVQWDDARASSLASATQSVSVTTLL